MLQKEFHTFGRRKFFNVNENEISEEQFSTESLFRILDNVNLHEQSLKSNYVYSMKHLGIIF